MADTTSLQTRLETITQHTLTPLARQSTQRLALEVLEWTLTRLHGSGGGTGESAIYRFAGQGRDAAGLCDWSIILKIAAAEPDQLPHSSHYWKREFEAYRSGWLNTLSGGLVAPRCFVAEEYPEACWMWLEDVTDTQPGPWSLARYELAAYHLGQFNGMYLNADLPEWEWLSRDWIRQDTAMANEFYATYFAVCLAEPLVRVMLPGDVPERIVKLWNARETFFAALDPLPKTLCHLDAFRRNLFTCETPDDCTASVAIDWAFIGPEVLGADLVSLVLVGVAFGEWDRAQAHALDAAVFPRYLDGLRDAGWAGDPQRVRLAYTVAMTLRYLAMCNYGVTPMTTGEGRALLETLLHQPADASARSYAQVTAFALEIADEACALLDQTARQG